MRCSANVSSWKDTLEKDFDIVISVEKYTLYKTDQTPLMICYGLPAYTSTMSLTSMWQLESWVKVVIRIISKMQSRQSKVELLLVSTTPPS